MRRSISSLTPRRWRCLAFAAALAACCAGADVASEARSPVDSVAPIGDAVRVDDTQALVASSDIALEQPNVLANQAVGLGNGSLGVAVWAADGLTVQLNRADTMPRRLSPGQVRFPDLAPLVADRGYRGRLRLHDGRFEAHGAGLALQVFVDRGFDRAVVDVHGLPVDRPQHIELGLWSSRMPSAEAQGEIALLAETWHDDTQPGRSGRSFGSLAAIRVSEGRGVARRVDARSVVLDAWPRADGHLQVLIAAPHFDGSTPALATAQAALAPPVDDAASVAWWHAFWQRAALIRADSADGVARYAQAQRTLYLFAAAAHNGAGLPGAQAGIADLFSSARDEHFWDPAAYWFWNLRMQLAANLAAGVPELNAATFALYRSNLDAMLRWTQAHTGLAGLCVPETMRFNGAGVEYESATLRPAPIVTHSCDLRWTAVANARTLSTGAELGLWIWRSWRHGGDRAFLEAHYALMAQAARFLLALQQPGADGLLHTGPSNAHETQADVHDPATDIAAIRSLFPATIAAARTLHRDSALVAQLEAALAKTPALPLMHAGSREAIPANGKPLPDDAVFAASADSTAPYVNGENIGLEAVWPYQVVDSRDARYAIAQRTFDRRPFVHVATWSFDPVQAAWVGRGDAAAAAIDALAQQYQIYPNGLSQLVPGAPHEFYLEQSAVTALALSSMLATQDDDGLVRIAPAVPKNWTMAGRVALDDGVHVDVDIANGVLTGFTLHAQRDAQVTIERPWPRSAARVMRGVPRARDDTPPQTGVLRIRLHRGEAVRIEPAGTETAKAPAEPPVDAPPAVTVKTLGRATIGIGPPCCAPPPGYDPTHDLP